jgi:hypothetical protein
MKGIPVNYTGVSFRENGLKALGRKLVSVGIRNAGDLCPSGWSGNGVQCSCPAMHGSQGAVALWRFEAGVDRAPVDSLVEDAARRTGAAYTSDTRARGPLGGGTLVTTTMNNDLEFVASFAPTFSAQAPQNASFAVLCIANKLAVEFSGSRGSFLRSVEYATINYQTLTSFTWEFSVLIKNLSGEQTFLSWHNSNGTYSMSSFKKSSNQLGFLVTLNSSNISLVSRMQFDAHKWYHLAITCDGGVAGMLRMWRLDTGGSLISDSHCVDDACLAGLVAGAVGRKGAGVGEGLLLLSASTSGCEAGLVVSAVGGGACTQLLRPSGRPCVQDSDCDAGAVCSFGYGFAAVVAAVDGNGSIRAVTVTNPGAGYLAPPKLVVNSGLCSCDGLAGNISGNMDSCLRAVPGTATLQRKDQWVLEAEAGWPSLEGWAARGDTAQCQSSSPEPCPFTSTPTAAGWRWTLGGSGSPTSPASLDGLLDEVRISARALDLSAESLWRP